uniref:G-protein coupled receptors family 1 profile domain-containing protein n=1 Tax=Oryzias sinensis TaxID=183150 RepID=A0A8C7WVR4_9TELE
ATLPPLHSGVFGHDPISNSVCLPQPGLTTASSNISTSSQFFLSTSPPSMDSRGVLPAVIMSLCFLLGVPGNIAVIILKPNFQQLSSMTQSLMLNLAVSDLLFLLTLPLWIYSLLYSWIFGLLACKILAYLMYCSVYGTLHAHSAPGVLQ